MTRRTWTLTDVATGTCLDRLSLGPAEIGGRAAGIAIEKRSLRGGSSAGVDVIRVVTGDLAYEVVPTRGMGVWKAWLGGEEIGWTSPVRGPGARFVAPLRQVVARDARAASVCAWISASCPSSRCGRTRSPPATAM